MSRSDRYSVNKMKFFLDNSEYEDNFVFTNVDFNYYWNSNFQEHFANWFNDGNDDYIIMVNTEEKRRDLVRAGIEEEKILLRKDYTKMRKYRNEELFWMWEYIKTGKVILYDIADVRLFENLNFYFALSKRRDKHKLVRRIVYNSAHIINQEFDRIVYISEDIQERYRTALNRVIDIDKILNS